MNTKKKLTKHIWDAGTMLVLLVTGALFYTVFIPSQIRLRAAWGGNTSFSSRTFPNMLVIALSACALIGLVKASVEIIRLLRLLKHERPEEDGSAPTPVMVHLAPYVTYAIVLAYTVLFREIGFVWATVLVPPVLMFVLGCRKWHLYAAVYAFAALLYAVFKVLMNVPLP